jgi:integrase
MPRLNKTIVDRALAKPGEKYFIWCSELPGFGVRIFPSGKRVYYADYRNGAGIRRRMSIGPHGKLTTDEARRLALAALGSAVRGEDPAEERATRRKSITVRELCERYFAAADKGLILGKRNRPKKPSTIYVDKGRAKRHIKPLLGSRRVRDLTAVDVNRFIADVTAGKTAAVVKTGKRGKAVVEGGPGTAARTAGLLGGILTFAVNQGVRPDNPARGVRRPAGKRRKRRILPAEWRALGKALATAEHDGETWQVIGCIRLLALTGCRPGEAIRLKWAEIDRNSKCFRFAETKEDESIRPLGQPALDVLAALPREKGAEFVFPAVRDEGGSFGGMDRGWDRIAARCGFMDISLGTFRHSFASEADDLGYTRITVKSMLGHSGAGDVTEGYVHKLDPVQIAAADRVSIRILRLMTRGPA